MGKSYTTEEFIAKAIAAHGNRYDYSKVDYVSGNKKVIITCPDHGDFLQAPYDHVRVRNQTKNPYAAPRASGCPTCGRQRMTAKNTMSHQGFLKRAWEIHGDKYDYTKTKYTNIRTRVTITCPDHGDFVQTPSAHVHLRYNAHHDAMMASGCPQCATYRAAHSRRITPDQYNEILKEKKGGTIIAIEPYFNNRTNIKHQCTVCQHVWSPRPANVLSGGGCPPCSLKQRAQAQMKTPEQFLIDAKNVHGDKYDYSKTVYTGAFEKVTITCPIHGDFEQAASSHTKGSGCFECGLEVTQEAFAKNYVPLTTAQFIQKAKEVHGDRYDYSKTKWVKATVPVVITCKEHGDFMLGHPHGHVSQGRGCPLCCANRTRTEGQFRETLEEYFSKFGDYKFPSIFPKWLRNPNSGHVLQLDGYCEELQLAFEFQGRQHYEPIDFYGGELNLIKVRRRDDFKKTICAREGVTLLCIDGRKVEGISSPEKRKKLFTHQLIERLKALPAFEKERLMEKIAKHTT